MRLPILRKVTLRLSHQQKLVAVFAVLVAMGAPFSVVSTPTSAYLTLARKWKNTNMDVINPIKYSISNSIDSDLRVSGAAGIIESQAAAKWNTSRILLVRDQASGNLIRGADFRYVFDPVCGTPPPAPGAVCNEPDPYDAGNVRASRMYLDTSPSRVWNTNQTMYCNSYPASVDVLTVVLHELGHFYGLEHDYNHQEAVMWPDCNVAKVDLREDDKNGVTQLYGIRTGWEPGFATGEINTVAYGLNIRGYGLPYPELGPRVSEFGAIPVSGSYMELLAGESLSSYSYAYMRLFTSANDSGGNRNYLQIRPGMRLKWFQYNHQQRTMSVDFRMTDGSTLRDSGLTTTTGLPVHPALRHNSVTRQWFPNDVDLTPLQGKVIDQWMIAYDNSQTGWQYAFRSYFDNVRVEY